MAETREVTTAEQLQDALGEGVADIEISGTITGIPRVVLPPGASLRGGRLEFGATGILLTRDNLLQDIEIVVPEHEIAVRADATRPDWGTLTLQGVTTEGQVALIAADAVRSGHIVIDALTVRAADLRGRTDRPRGFGVEAMQGGLTVWNRQATPPCSSPRRSLPCPWGRRGLPCAAAGSSSAATGTTTARRPAAPCA
ncbi:hypothetical protein [Brachybacterium vulturis]|uniref:hypothetical protein n=1 Tax=Brachybacterium vulturis TaxID=2017484 RepID=UPI0037355559